MCSVSVHSGVVSQISKKNVLGEKKPKLLSVCQLGTTSDTVTTEGKKIMSDDLVHRVVLCKLNHHVFRTA